MKINLLKEDMLMPYGRQLLVSVDGYKAKCSMGTFGGYTTRINFSFEDEHPEFGKDFQTKYFKFVKPGVISWGFNGKTLNVEVLSVHRDINFNAIVNPFGSKIL